MSRSSAGSPETFGSSETADRLRSVAGAASLRPVQTTSSGDRARYALAGSRFADVRWFARSDSTNSQVLELARQGEPEGIVVVADHQTSGRGRRGRSWDAPVGAALMCTVLVRPPATVAGMATMVAGVAMAGAVEDRCGISLGLKWPNDLVWNDPDSRVDRKVAGILAEAEWPASSNIAGGWSPPSATERVVVAVGLGLNVRWPDGMPTELAETAVALDEILESDEGDPRLDRTELLVSYLQHFERRYDSLVGRSGSGGAAELRDEWTRRSATLGRRVRIDLGADDLEGVASAITDDGRLVVDTVEGERRIVAVGDVVHLRPTGESQDDPG